MPHLIFFFAFILISLFSVALPRVSLASITDLDPSFGTSGRVQLDLGSGASSRGNSLILLPDGKLLVAGSLTPSGGSQVGVVLRLNNNGTIDTSFGPNGDGMFTAVFGQPREINGLVRQESDGKLIAVGGSNAFTVTLIRLTADGILDPSFDGDGEAEVTNVNTTKPAAVVIQDDGRIVVAANRGTINNDGFTLFRLEKDGTLDTAFGTGGFARAPVTGTDKAQGLVIQADGKIVVVGTTNADANPFLDPNLKDFAIARFNSDGSLDTTFDTDGMKVIDVASRDDDALSVLIQSDDGKIVIAGSAYMTASRPDCTVVRLNPDGSPDAGFDADGKATFYMGGLSICASLSRQPDKTFIGAGTYADAFDRQFIVTRILADGQPDTTFNNGESSAFARFLPSDRAFAYAHAVQSDGKIVLAGEVDLSGIGTQYNIALARFQTLASGTPGTLGFAAANSGVAESAGTVAVEVSRTGGTTGSVSVSYTTVAGTTVSGEDFSTVGATLTWADGDSASKTIQVPILADCAVEGSETFTLNLSNPTNSASMGNTSHTITINDDSSNTIFSFGNQNISYSYATVHISEGHGNLVVIVTRSGSTCGAASVDFATVQGPTDYTAAFVSEEALADIDYITTNGTLNWNAGVGGGKSFVVPILNDTLEELSKSFTIVLRNPTHEGGNAILGPQNELTIVINRNDAPTAGEILFFDDYVFYENANQVDLIVGRRGGSQGALVVDYNAKDLYAKNGIDYTLLSGTLTWADGDDTARIIPLMFHDDSTYEGDEYFRVNLTAVSPTDLTTFGTVVTIVDDDPVPPGITPGMPPGGFVGFVSDSVVVDNLTGSSFTAFFQVERTGGTIGEITVSWATVALPYYFTEDGVDYEGGSGYLSWADGESGAKEIPIKILTGWCDRLHQLKLDGFEVKLQAIVNGNARIDSSKDTLAVRSPTKCEEGINSSSSNSSNSGSGGCFIATVAYGTPLANELRVLRQFRDRFLMTNGPGRAFVSWYYRASPPVAAWLTRHDEARTVVRTVLTPLVYAIKYPAGAGSVLLAGVLIVAVAVRRRRKPLLFSPHPRDGRRGRNGPPRGEGLTRGVWKRVLPYGFCEDVARDEGLGPGIGSVPIACVSDPVSGKRG